MFKVIRRIIGRNNPEAMFRELIAVYENDFGPEGLDYGTLRLLESLKEFGYDTAFIRRQVAASKKTMAKNRSDAERNSQRELQAGAIFALGEEMLRRLRYRECDPDVYILAVKIMWLRVAFVLLLVPAMAVAWLASRHPEIVASVGERNAQIIEYIWGTLFAAAAFGWLVLRIRLWWRSGRPLPKFRWL